MMGRPQDDALLETKPWPPRAWRPRKRPRWPPGGPWPCLTWKERCRRRPRPEPPGSAATWPVQQQIQVLAADQRSLSGNKAASSICVATSCWRTATLAAPDEARLTNLQSQLTAAQEAANHRRPAARGCRTRCPSSTTNTRARQPGCEHPRARGRPTCRRAWKALKALQEKVKTDGKLKPWLAKHGLDGLPGPGPHPHRTGLGEPTSRRAARGAERAGRCRGWTLVRSFAGDCAASKLAFGSPPQAAVPGRPAPAAPVGPAPERRQARRPCWPTGCTAAAAPLRTRTGGARKPKPGGQSYVKTGHAVTALAVAFTRRTPGRPACWRAQEVRNLDKRLKAPGADCRGKRPARHWSRGSRVFRRVPASW